MYNPASTFGANASAKMYVHPSAALTFTYVSSGLTQRAVLDGNVQGVVVHTKKNTSSSFFLNLAIADFSFTVLYPCATSCDERGGSQGFFWSEKI